MLLLCSNLYKENLKCFEHDNIFNQKFFSENQSHDSSHDSSCEVLNKPKSRGFRASSLSTYDFSTLNTNLSHNLMKDKLVDLIERIFQREGSHYIACNNRNAYHTSDAIRNYNL